MSPSVRSPSVGRAYRLAITVLAAMLLMGSLWTIPDVTQMVVQAMLYAPSPSRAPDPTHQQGGLMVLAVTVMLSIALAAWLLHKAGQRKRWAVICWSVLQVMSALSLPDYVNRMDGPPVWTLGTFITVATGVISTLVTAALWHPALRQHWWHRDGDSR